MSDKKAICSPTQDSNNYTCYSSKSLLRLRELWNKRHPDVKIEETSPKEIWSALKKICLMFVLLRNVGCAKNSLKIN